MPYIGTTPTKVVSRQSANVYRYTATAGQSVFTGADLDNNVLACNPADMIVHMNGLRLESTDYTATSTSVTLTTAATAGDEVTVTSFVTFEVADTYTKTAADSRYVNTTGDTMTGDLNVLGNVGIGTTSPATMLDLYKAQASETTFRITNTSTSAGSGAKITAEGSSNKSIDVGIRSVNDAAYGALDAESGYVWYDGATSLVLGATNAAGIIKFNTGGISERMRIDSAGRVTMPYQPAFCARSGGGFKNTQGVIPYEIAEVNVGNCYSTSNYRFTVPVSGKYLFSWFGLLGPNQTNGSVGQTTLYMRVNSLLWITYHSNGDDYWDQSGGTAIASLSAGDYIDMYLNQGGVYFGDSTNGYSKFSGYLIG